MANLDLETEPTLEIGPRRVKWLWHLQDLGEGCVELLTLTVTHDREAKTYYAMVDVERRGPRSVVLDVGGAVTLCRERTDRYSERHLHLLAQLAVNDLRAIVANPYPDDNPITSPGYRSRDSILAMLAPSDRSCGCSGMHHRPGCPVYAAQIEEKRTAR